MAQSIYYSQPNDTGSIKDTVSDAATSVKDASVDAYEAVRDTAQDQPFFSGLLVGGLVGFALGAVWKLQSRQSLPAHMLDSFHSYADPSARYLRNRVGR
jgi:hypothetical protein